MRRAVGRTHGFTLIELLVVIAIIAILAAILYPVFVRARERAKVATCVSNLKQIAMAYQMYTDRYNGAFPDQTSVGFTYTGGAATAGTARQWMEAMYRYREDDLARPAGLAKALRPYFKNYGIFKCPSEWKDNLWPKGSQQYDAQPWNIDDYRVRSSYYLKLALMTYADYYSRPVTMAVVLLPSKAAMLYEQGWHSYPKRPFLWDVFYWNEQPEGDRPFAMRVNVVFLDCHVGSIDIPYKTSAGYDGNWYVYHLDGSQWGRYWDLERGARDKR